MIINQKVTMLAKVKIRINIVSSKKIVKKVDNLIERNRQIDCLAMNLSIIQIRFFDIRLIIVSIKSFAERQLSCPMNPLWLDSFLPRSDTSRPTWPFPHLDVNIFSHQFALSSKLSRLILSECRSYSLFFFGSRLFFGLET